MSLNPQQCQFLRGLAHGKKPVVTVGSAGLTDSVTNEIDGALEHHELLKIKLPPVHRLARRQLAETICASTRANLVHIVGRIAVVYRAANKPKLSLPI
ncbi:MAG: YhbY family RNA-binding protein [Gammaproteobacteria bacterium]|nr:YhbY family RNA-binding protein [Gammaproteobacteria bacterium]